MAWYHTGLKHLKTLLYNNKYNSRSLYGAGIFPYWVYIKFYGKPSYTFARKRGLNTYFSLMVANIPGSIFHVNFFNDGTWSEVGWFIFSLFLCTTAFYGIHLNYHRLRRKYV